MNIAKYKNFFYKEISYQLNSLKKILKFFKISKKGNKYHHIVEIHIFIPNSIDFIGYFREKYLTFFTKICAKNFQRELNLYEKLT